MSMQSIILSRRDFREYDQIISLYTKEQGKVEALVRGVKKIVSKNSAHLEPFCYDLVEVVKGKEIDHLTKVTPIDFFVGIRQNLEKSMASGFLMQCADSMIKAGEPDKRIWDLLLGWLKFVEKVPKFEVLLVDAFMVSLLHCLGFTPILDKCVVCGKLAVEIIKEELDDPNMRAGLPSVALAKGGFYFSGGGLICPSCRAQKERIGESVFSCGLKEISNMAILQTANWPKISTWDIDSAEKKSLHKLVYEFVVYHAERKVMDWVF